MVGNVSALLKTVKSAEDEAARGARAIEAALGAIRQEMDVSFSCKPLLCSVTVHFDGCLGQHECCLLV